MTGVCFFGGINRQLFISILPVVNISPFIWLNAILNKKENRNRNTKANGKKQKRRQNSLALEKTENLRHPLSISTDGTSAAGVPVDKPEPTRRWPRRPELTAEEGGIPKSRRPKHPNWRCLQASVFPCHEMRQGYQPRIAISQRQHYGAGFHSRITTVSAVSRRVCKL